MTAKQKLIPTLLRQNFDRKKKVFPALSARYLAKRLNVSPGYISQIFSGKRELPARLLDLICDLLDIDNETREVMASELLHLHGWQRKTSREVVNIAAQTSAHTKDWETPPVSSFHILGSWVSVGILEATSLAGYDGSLEFLAQATGLELSVVQKAVSDLSEAGFLREQDGVLRKHSRLLDFQSKAHKDHLSAFHESNMQKAQEVMRSRRETLDFETRLVTSAIFTCSEQNIPLLRAKTAEFIREITALGASSRPTDLYQIGIQLVPIGKSPKAHSKS